jgi:hypothetical protein
MDPLRGARYRDLADLRPAGAPLPDVGEWVTTYHQGIWQVYRVLTYTTLNPSSGLEGPHATVFAKRIVSRTFRRAFSETCCSPAFVHELDESLATRLLAFIRENDRVYQQFVRYRPKAVDCVWNARMVPAPELGVEAVAALFPAGRVFRAREIDGHIAEVGLSAPRLGPSWTAQFVSHDHTCEAGHRVFRFHRVLPF